MTFPRVLWTSRLGAGLASCAGFPGTTSQPFAFISHLSRTGFAGWGHRRAGRPMGVHLRIQAAFQKFSSAV